MPDTVEWRLGRVRVHLSRLWTDTSTQNLRKMSCGEKVNYVKTLVGRSTSAPVTSMDRHTSTKSSLSKIGSY